MHQPDKKITFLAAAIATTFGVSSAHASGFRIPEISTFGLGTSNAVVANTKEEGALPYNPAAMAFHDKDSLVLGLSLVAPDPTATPDGGSKTDSQGEDVHPIPNVFLHSKINNQWDFGLAMNAPFGLETKWPAGTFPLFGAIGGPIAGLEPEHSSIEMLNFNPNLSYKINNNASLAFGADYYDVNKLVFNTQAATITGKGDGWGWNIGLIYTLQNWNFGLSYRSKVDTSLSGSIAKTLPASAKLEFPDMLQFGAYWQVTQAWGLELDAERTGWSSFDQLSIECPPNPSVPCPITSTNNWKNVWAYRFGAIYDINVNSQLRLGYSFDETGQPDDYFSARVPDADRQLFSVGYAYDYGNWKLELGYMYVLFDDRTINQPAGSYLARIGAGDTDPNGTDAYNGKYESTVHLFSVGAVFKF